MQIRGWAQARGARRQLRQQQWQVHPQSATSHNEQRTSIDVHAGFMRSRVKSGMVCTCHRFGVCRYRFRFADLQSLH
jgi:hypothetical protein